MTKPIISFLILFTSIVFIFIYVVPAYNLNVERRGDIKSLERIISQSSEIKPLIDATKTNLGSIEQSGLDRFEVFLPEKIDTIRFANNIQHIGRANRVTLSDIKVEESAGGATQGDARSASTASQGLVKTVSLGAKIDMAAGTVGQGVMGTANKEEKYATTKASFTFTSTFETFQAFLYDLEKSLGLVDVISLSFSPVASDAGTKATKTPPTPTYQYSMAIETYSLK